MTPNILDISLKAVGVTLAGASTAFAGYMLACGGGEVRVLGMEHLAIFAQPRGAAIAAPPPRPAPPAAALDMAATGSLAESPPRPEPPARPEIVAARGDRVWLRMGATILAAAPGDDVKGFGHIGAIVRRDGGWAVLDDKGTTLSTLPRPSNGAALFSRKLIFE